MDKFRRIAKKNLAAVIAIAVIIVGAGTVYGGLRTQQADMGVNPVVGENPQKTQVLLEGDGYKLTKEQKSRYDLPQKIEKKDNQVNKINPAANNPTKYFNNHKFPSRKLDYSPIISTDLKKQTVTAGESITFWVEGKTYTRSPIRTSNYVVKIGNTTVTGTGSTTHCSYTVEIPEGKNTIKITVTDPLRKKSTTKTFVVTGVKAKEKYSVTAVFSAPEITVDGSELNLSVTCECSEGDSLSDVLKAVNSELNKQGYSISPLGKTPTYLSLNTKADLDLTASAREKYGDEETVPPLPDQNGIKNGIFVDGSAWVIEGGPSSVTEDTSFSITFSLGD